MIDTTIEFELGQLLEEYEQLVDQIISLENGLKESPKYLELQNTIDQKNRLELTLKDRIKVTECRKVEGSRFRFVYEPRVTRTRIYDIEKIKLNDRLRNQVLIESVDEKAFLALEKANVIPDSASYYSVSEKVTKAVKIEKMGQPEVNR